MIQPLRGEELHLFIDDKTIASALGFTLNASCDYLEAASPTSGVVTKKIINKIRYSITADSLTTDDTNRLYDIFNSRTPFIVMIGLATKDHLDDEDYFLIDTSTGYFYGTGILDSLNVTASNGEISSFNASIQLQEKLEYITV